MINSQINALNIQIKQNSHIYKDGSGNLVGCLEYKHSQQRSSNVEMFPMAWCFHDSGMMEHILHNVDECMVNVASKYII